LVVEFDELTNAPKVMNAFQQTFYILALQRVGLFCVSVGEILGDNALHGRSTTAL